MQKFLCSEKGATAIEYGLIAALMVVVILGSIAALGQKIQTALYSGLATMFN
jgi:Flp pilus assembly pilin Flp